jgi:hypothetical protein
MRRVRSCVQKHPHKSRGAALAHIRSIERRDLETALHLQPYFCVYCKSWHVGHKRPAKSDHEA